MTLSALVLKGLMPGGGATRDMMAPDGTIADPAGTDGVGERRWSRIEVRMASPSAGRGAYHFVIAPAAGGVTAVTSVRPLWKKQEASALDLSDSRGDSVYIALIADEEGHPPAPDQWQALGLLIKQLRGRYGVSKVAFDADLDGDPRTRNFAAAW